MAESCAQHGNCGGASASSEGRAAFLGDWLWCMCCFHASGHRLPELEWASSGLASWPSRIIHKCLLITLPALCSDQLSLLQTIDEAGEMRSIPQGVHPHKSVL